MERSTASPSITGTGGLLVLGLCSITLLFTSSALAQDTDPPRTEIVSGPIGLTRDNQPQFSLVSTEPGSTFTCRLDSLALLPCGPAFYEPPEPLTEGPHQIYAYATDPAGNTDPIGAGRQFIVDRSITEARLIGPRKQRVEPRDLSVNIELRGQEALEVEVKGVLTIGKRRLKMRPLERRLGDRTAIKPSLTAPPEVEREVARAFRRGRPVATEVVAKFRDEVGNSERLTRVIALK
jgi:hypothetical protein